MALTGVGWASAPEPVATLEPVTFNIRSQPLDTALITFASQSGIDVIAVSDSLSGHRAPELRETLPPLRALERLLADSDLGFALGSSGGYVTVRKLAPPIAAVESATTNSRSIEEFVVYGIRRSLQTAAEIKRESHTIADAISAQELGKFPDANVADSLQRVTGVQISRDVGGEGRFVSIRGLGSQFNITTMNGRLLATDNTGRDFSFDVMPSEAIASARVFKTPTASQPDGSTGGLIDLQTVRPLDRAEPQGTTTAGAFYDGHTEDWTGHYSVAFSNTFLDGTLGASAGLSHYRRNWRSDTFETFLSTTESVEDYTGEAGSRGLFPGIISYQTKSGTRERAGVTGTLQLRPNQQVETTFDLFYSRYETPEEAFSYNVNFYSNEGSRRFENAVLEPWEGASGNNRWLISEFDLSDIPLEVGTDIKARKTDTYMLGWNTRWQLSDDFNLAFDTAVSDASRPTRGEEYYTVTGVPGGDYHYATGSSIPSIFCTLPDGRNCLDVESEELGLHFLNPRGEGVHDRVVSARADADIDVRLAGLDTVIEFGLTYSARTKLKDVWQPGNPCLFCGFEKTLGDVGVDAEVPFPKGGYSPGASPGFNGWPALDAQALLQAARLHAGENQFVESIVAQSQLRASSEIDERIGGLYLQLNFTGSGWQANLGGRWAHTWLESRGYSQNLLSIEQIPGSTNFEATFSNLTPVSAKNTHRDFLPSANVKLDLSRDMALRLAAARTITRPTISKLGLDVNWEINSSPPRLTHNGDPHLTPIHADSLDLSLEWYGDGGNYWSAAVFHKFLDGFTAQQAFSRTVAGQTFDVFAPVNSGRATIRGLEISAQYLLDSGWGLQTNYTRTGSDADTRSEASDLDGLSENTYNLIGIYENDIFSARLAWSYRDAFTACSTCGPAATPTETSAFSTLNLSTSFRLSDSLAFYLEAQNLTEEDTHTYYGDTRANAYYEPYARRIELGVRAQF